VVVVGRVLAGLTIARVNTTPTLLEEPTTTVQSRLDEPLHPVQRPKVNPVAGSACSRRVWPVASRNLQVPRQFTAPLTVPDPWKETVTSPVAGAAGGGAAGAADTVAAGPLALGDGDAAELAGEAGAGLVSATGDFGSPCRYVQPATTASPSSSSAPTPAISARRLPGPGGCAVKGSPAAGDCAGSWVPELAGCCGYGSPASGDGGE
jgi:hypothetical protein